ncbi:hypothetical protein BBP40_003410 [Aspergillus hancockii]|nr:hypothetical protein BBP40_003410 [Aspergillus hancockii]
MAVTGANGGLYAVGNPSRITLARSTAKPAQALAILDTGGFDQFNFNDVDLALMCASHNSEERHIARARARLAKIQAEGDLRCGGHPALSPAVNRAWFKNDFTPITVHNNCSGKHTGMLVGSKALDSEIANYHLPDHRMQVQVKWIVEELTGLEEDGIS